jgi:Fe-S oxidoreductase
VWSAGGRATVLSCIGCGRVDTAQQCAGTCGEYAAEIVPAAAHDRAAARLEGLRRHVDALVALTARLAAHGAGADDVEVVYRALQAEARAVLRALPAAEEDDDAAPERLAVWSCGCCGRMEAEAPCVGICTDERLEVVRGDVHDEVLAQLRAADARRHELSGLVRRLAFSTPRAGGWEASFRALRRRARELVAPTAT